MDFELQVVPKVTKIARRLALGSVVACKSVAHQVSSGMQLRFARACGSAMVKILLSFILCPIRSNDNDRFARTRRDISSINRPLLRGILSGIACGEIAIARHRTL